MEKITRITVDTPTSTSMRAIQIQQIARQGTVYGPNLCCVSTQNIHIQFYTIPMNWWQEHHFTLTICQACEIQNSAECDQGNKKDKRNNKNQVQQEKFKVHEYIIKEIKRAGGNDVDGRIDAKVKNKLYHKDTTNNDKQYEFGDKHNPQRV